MYDRIKELCALRGISVQSLEKAAGLSNGSISKWVNSTPKADALYRVAEILGTTSGYLLNGNDNAPRSGLRIRPNPPPAENNPSLTLRLPDNKKSPAPNEGEAKQDELTRLFSAADPWVQEQVLSLLRAAESAKQAPGEGK